MAITRSIALLCLTLVAELALAACPTRDFTDPARVRLNGDSVLIVTHATSTHDARHSTKRGVDEATRFAKDRRIPTLYLVHDGADDHYFMDAIYSNGRSIEATDSYFGDFQQFMSVVTYGRPAGEHWPKLTLLETMGVIRKEEHELEYLKKILPHYARTLPAEYRVELKLNDSVVKVLRSAPGWNPPTVRFHFVDSAVTHSL